MDRPRRREYVSDGEDGRRHKRGHRSASTERYHLRRTRRRPPLAPTTRGRRGDSDRSRSSGRRRADSRSTRSRGGSRSRSRESRSRSRRRTSGGGGSGVRSRTRSGRRHSRSRRGRTDSYRNRRDGYGSAARSSRSFSARSSRRSAPRTRRGKKPYRRDSRRDESEPDDSDDSGGHDDTIGSFEGKPGEYIASRYKIIREAGLGTFGRVLECLDKQRNMIVAIKVVRKVEKYTESAKIEANILQDVNDKDEHNESLCVRMFKWFEYHGHVCMVFERLGCSLYEYLKSHDYQPFPLHCIRSFAWQLLTALEFIHSIRLIHTDLKPENILLVDDEEDRVASSSPSSTSSYSSPNGKTSQWSNGRHARQDYALPDGDPGRLTCRPPASCAVKLIDFGGATYDDESKSSIINTRQYRSPEVILGLGWSFPSDIWSAGCIIAELYIGELLFATHDNLEHLALIERCIGRLPTYMVSRAADHAAKCIRRDRLNWPDGASNDESIEHVRRMRSLKQILRPEDAATGLLDLLQLMLVLDPENRITAKEALKHQFFDGFSRQHIVNGTGCSSLSQE